MRLIVPFAAGGAADIIGRTIADKLGTLYGKTIIVENMAGAGSNIGINAAVKAEPDGHTLVLGAIAVAINPFLYKSMPFDPAKDLAPLTLALETPNIVIVPATSNVQTLADLIAKAKTAPLNYASAGIGSSLHLAAELFKQQAKVDLAHVAYRGSNPALTDLIAGRMDVMFDNASTALPQIEAKTVRAIAVTTKQRLATLPDVPTDRRSRRTRLRDGQLVGTLHFGKSATRNHGKAFRRLAQGPSRSRGAEKDQSRVRAHHSVQLRGTGRARRRGGLEMEVGHRSGRHSREPVGPTASTKSVK